MVVVISTFFFFFGLHHLPLRKEIAGKEISMCASERARLRTPSGGFHPTLGEETHRLLFVCYSIVINVKIIFVVTT